VGLNLTTELENLWSVQNTAIKRCGLHQAEIHKNINLSAIED